MTTRTATPLLDREAVQRTLAAARRHLLAARIPAGHWEGRLSSSALSTATALTALDIVRRHGGTDRSTLVHAGLRWLSEHQNADGGFGDTPDSPSNISTTTLCWAALGPGDAAGCAEAWLRREVGDLTPPRLAETISRRYGVDRTFSVPILTMCALAGKLPPEAWTSIPRLPFELAALPRFLFRWLNLQVVSYALPALIAIGQAHPKRTLLGRLTRGKTLRVLESLQPASGGFLEATPLTSFVTMSLAASGQVDHTVTRKGAEFLVNSAREDGSWPIDTNLATWVTTLSVQALGSALPAEDRIPIAKWLLVQRGRTVHPYTGAAPGGWAWTDLPGGVPDADDTAGALLALSQLCGDDSGRRPGVQWLLDLQNRDGGIPTFCRGWGKLPFDRSSPDLTAHAIRAWCAVAPSHVEQAVDRAFDFLVRSQRSDGSWTPLWFGSQTAEGQENPVYGTSRVLECAALSSREDWKRAVDRATEWLRAAQSADGGFGSSIEETALAVGALAGHAPEAVARGCRWLVERTAEGTRFDPAPIGLYFAKLWYSERLYPIIFTVSALERALA